MELAVGGLDRARVFLADAAGPVRPVIATANGAQGQFLASINADGKTMEFTSPDAFQKAQSQVVEILIRQPDQFITRWPDLVEPINRIAPKGGIDPGGPIGRDAKQSFLEGPPSQAGNGNFSGTLHIDGKTIQFKSMEDNGAFRGRIDVDGKATEFISKKEFEKAREIWFDNGRTLGLPPR
jgi:hypothetical protein